MSSETKQELSRGQRLPHIDKSTIIDKDFWKFEQVVKAERWLQEQLLTPGYIEKLSTHEGAHLYYVRKILPLATIRPPSVVYNPKKVRFQPLEAGIDISGINLQCDRARLITFTKGLFAGGVLEGIHTLIQDPDKSPQEVVTGLGDKDDDDEFPEYCERIRNASPGLIFDNAKVRKEAIEGVFADAMTPQIKAEIEATIEEVRQFILTSIYPNVPPNVFPSDGSSNS
jgi:hypothetical protein